MDPEGIREVYYAECGAAADYGFRRAMRELPFHARWKESFFYGVHLPLTRPLPKRLDTTLQQHTGLHAYDAVALADIDPVVFDADDLLNLLAYVEGGGGLLLMAGPNSFVKAQRNWGPLREALPAAYVLQPQKRTKLWNEPFPGAPDQAPAPVTLGVPHPVTRGLTGTLGAAVYRYALQAKPDAAVLATADSEPLVVAGLYGNGRVLMVGAFPGTDAGCMFRTTAWRDLLRQALTWLMGRDGDLVIERSDVSTAALPLGQERVCELHLAAEAAGACRAAARLARADPGWLAAGREPQYGAEQAVPAAVDGRRVAFRFAPREPGLWRVRLDVAGDTWANVRVIEALVRSASHLQLATRDGEYVSAPGRVLPLEVRADRPVSARVRILDEDGVEVWRRDDALVGPLDVPLPALELGEYLVTAEAGKEAAALRFCVTQPLRHIGFSLVANATGGATEERVRWWFDYFRSRGFDAFATALGGGAKGGRAAVGANLTAYQHYLVQSAGLDLWGEYVGAALLSTHAHYGAEGSRPTRPCVFGPDYGEALRKLLEERFQAANLPRMASLEILDEPHLMRANVCRCEHCLREFRKRRGYDMPTWDEALEARDRRTKDYFEWVVDYAAEAFRQGYKRWKSFGRGPRLHHVLCALGSGSLSARQGVAEDLVWAAHADFFEFDCYNYMYPNWRCADRLRWNEFHYLMGHFRFLALRNKQRFGFFIQVTDRDVPVTAWDPLRAPSETLYTAIGGGAKTFHLMAKGEFTNTQNCREDKFEAFAADIRRVQRVAPLLDRAATPRSRIAMVFAFHDRLYRPPERRLPAGYAGLGFYSRDYRPYDNLWPNHKAPVNVCELLFRAFGATDVIDQRALHEGALDDYGGFVLTGVDYIADEDARAVAQFVERGGALICDHVPTHNTAGAASAILAPLFQGASAHFHRDATLTRAAHGKGRTLLFSQDLNELYSSAVEADDGGLRQLLETAARRFFFDAGLRPHVHSGNPEVEADVLLTADTLVLVVVNHAATRQDARITLYAPPVPVQAACDLVTMRPQRFAKKGGDVELEVELDEREGAIFGLYPAVPVKSDILLDSPTARAGDRLTFTVRLFDSAGKPARGEHLVEVSVRDPKGAERRQFGGLLCAVNGMLRIDRPLAVNARRGEWTLTAFDRFTTRQVTATVTVK